MLATDSIDLSVKIFSFFTDSIDHRSEKKNFSPIKSNHRLKIFFSSKDHRSNRCFLQLIDYRYRSNRCFFRHWCQPMGPPHPQELGIDQGQLTNIASQSEASTWPGNGRSAQGLASGEESFRHNFSSSSRAEKSCWRLYLLFHRTQMPNSLHFHRTQRPQ